MDFYCDVMKRADCLGVRLFYCTFSHQPSNRLFVFGQLLFLPRTILLGVKGDSLTFNQANFPVVSCICDNTVLLFPLTLMRLDLLSVL